MYGNICRKHIPSYSLWDNEDNDTDFRKVTTTQIKKIMNKEANVSAENGFVVPRFITKFAGAAVDKSLLTKIDIEKATDYGQDSVDEEFYESVDYDSEDLSDDDTEEFYDTSEDLSDDDDDWEEHFYPYSQDERCYDYGIINFSGNGYECEGYEESGY